MHAFEAPKSFQALVDSKTHNSEPTNENNNIPTVPVSGWLHATLGNFLAAKGKLLINKLSEENISFQLL